MIGQNSTAAIDFSDRKAAAEVLGALRREPPVVAACLYDKRGLLFSEYQRDAGAMPCSRQVQVVESFTGEFRNVSRSIRRATDFVGSIEVIADTRDLKYRNQRLLAIAILVALASLTLAGCSRRGSAEAHLEAGDSIGTGDESRHHGWNL